LELTVRGLYGLKTGQATALTVFHIRNLAFEQHDSLRR
jgi:hypothetical protein